MEFGITGGHVFGFSSSAAPATAGGRPITHAAYPMFTTGRPAGQTAVAAGRPTSYPALVAVAAAHPVRANKLHSSSFMASAVPTTWTIPGTIKVPARVRSTSERGIPSLLKRSEERIASDITDLVGWTPLVQLNQVADGCGARIIAKLEYYQPFCSIKDRTALRMIQDAEEKKLIKPGDTTLVEVTSGNMGISIACIAALRGYKFIAVMPAEYSRDKEVLLQYLGAKVFLTAPNLNFQEMCDEAEKVKNKEPNRYILSQFTNAANPEAHYIWTGPEIWKDTAGKIDIFVAASGTGGTVSGVGRYLKEKNPAIKVFCVEPAKSDVISRLIRRKRSETEESSYKGGNAGRSHKIQGIGPGIVPENLDLRNIDEPIITVTCEEAIDNARRLALEEGLLVGISSGANLAACLKVAAREENKGKMIVTVFPSGAERYKDSDLFMEARKEVKDATF